MLKLTALQAYRSVCGHTHASAVLDEQLCEHSVFPELRTWQIWFTHMEISRITAGEGKNSEFRVEWRSSILSANPWHSTLWLELILPTGTTCAPKQMGNEILEVMPHFKTLNYHLSSKQHSLILCHLVHVDDLCALHVSHLIFTQTTTKWNSMPGQGNVCTVLRKNGLWEQKHLPDKKFYKYWQFKMKVIQLLHSWKMLKHDMKRPEVRSTV